MVQIEVTEDQARLINHCLELYSRLGIGQFDYLKEHWSIEKMLWDKQQDVYHDIGNEELLELRNKLFQMDMGLNGSWGIYNEEADDTVRIAFDIQQVIRHELWKQDPNRSDMVVSSHVHFTSKNEDVNKIKAKTI